MTPAPGVGDDRWLVLGLAGALAPAVLVVVVVGVALGSGTSLPAVVVWPLASAVLVVTLLRVAVRVRLFRRITAGRPPAERRRLRRLLLAVAGGYGVVLAVAGLVWWATGEPGWAVTGVAALLVLALLAVVVLAARRQPPRATGPAAPRSGR